jgi:DNA mismatch endonuclease, patch repair protein
MTDVFTSAKRSEVMSRIRGRGNISTELRLAQLLRSAGLSGWRRHRTITCEFKGASFSVRPDFVFRRELLAVFADGCFWHCCKLHFSIPANNNTFWTEKLAANRRRDRLVNRALRSQGWRVLRIWEHELQRKPPTRLISRVRRALGR